MIEPVAGHDFSKEIEQPHIVYKRSPDEYQSTALQDLCNVIGETSRIIAKRALNPQKRVSAIENRSYTLELLVVLDKSLLDYHKEFDVENYVLTLFNMASLIVFQKFCIFASEFLREPLFSGCRIVSRHQFRCTYAIDHSENYKIRGGGKWGKVRDRNISRSKILI